MGELTPLSQNDLFAYTEDADAATLRAEREGSFYARAELLSSLLSRGKRDRARILATDFVHSENSPAALKRLASRLIADEPDDELPEPQAGPDFNPSAFARSLASRARKRINRRPANPIAWVDLALAHTIQAQPELAAHELRVALQLAPDSRFVLRAASRFYVHIDNPEYANRLLHSSPRLEHDPWLMAAELSTAHLAFGKSRSTGAAREMVASQKFSPRALSELVSELATAELQSGRDRRARLLFLQSFADPTENAVAQAVSWSDRSGIELAPQLFQISRVFEARALGHARVGAWAEATADTLSWHQDQPFSLEPFHFASYTASFGSGDYSQAALIALAGLKLHPADQVLRNNAAYALAHLGRTEEAEALVLQPLNPSTVDEFTELATVGLIRFRQQNLDSGTSLYQQAIGGFEKLKRKDLAAMANIHLALEEIRANPSGSVRAKQRAERALRDLPPAERETLTARLSSSLK